MQIFLEDYKTYKKFTLHPRSASGSSSMNWGHRCLPCNCPSKTVAVPYLLYSWAWGKVRLKHATDTEAATVLEMKKSLR